MRSIFTCLLIGLAASFSSTAQAATDNYLVPNAQITMTPQEIGDYGAFSALGEVGEKNFRGSGTYGVYVAPCHRLKVSGEYLTQKLRYDFVQSDTKKWVSQYALGTEYQYLLLHSFFQSIDAGSSYSHAFDREMETKHPQANQTLRRRVAGSDAGFGYVGSTVRLWKCGFFSADVNYDYVKYHRKYQTDKLANGWGSSLSLTQLMPKDLSLTLEADFRRPFYFYEGTINWNRSFSSWAINCGLYGNFTEGKEGLPNVVAGGIQLGFSFGPKNDRCCRAFNKDTSKEVAPDCNQKCYSRTFCDLSNWVSNPAVYVPVVLAIADSKLTTQPIQKTCSLPNSTAIPNRTFFELTTISIAMSPYFSSSLPLTYSATGLPFGLRIDPNTGIISGTTPHVPTSGETYTVVVTATSSCGSTSQTFNLIINPNV